MTTSTAYCGVGMGWFGAQCELNEKTKKWWELGLQFDDISKSFLVYSQTQNGGIAVVADGKRAVHQTCSSWQAPTPYRRRSVENKQHQCGR